MKNFLEFLVFDFCATIAFVYTVLAIWMRIYEPDEYKVAKKEIGEYIRKVFCTAD